MKNVIVNRFVCMCSFSLGLLFASCSANDLTLFGEQNEDAGHIVVSNLNPFEQELVELERHIFVDIQLDANVPVPECVYENFRKTFLVNENSQLAHTDTIYNSDFLPAYLKSLVLSGEGAELLSMDGFDSLLIPFPSIAFYLMYDTNGGVCVSMVDGVNVQFVHYSCPAMVSKQLFVDYERNIEQIYEEKVLSVDPYSVNTASFGEFDSIINKKWHELAKQEKTVVPDDFYKLKIHKDVYPHSHELVDTVYCEPIIPSKIRWAQKELLPNVTDSVAGSIAISIVKLLYMMDYNGTINGVSFDVFFFERGLLTRNLNRCAAYFYDNIVNATDKTHTGLELLQNCGYSYSLTDKYPYEYVELLNKKKVLIAVEKETGAWLLMDGIYEIVYSCYSSMCNIPFVHFDANGMNDRNVFIENKSAFNLDVYEYVY